MKRPVIQRNPTKRAFHSFRSPRSASLHQVRQTHRTTPVLAFFLSLVLGVTSLSGVPAPAVATPPDSQLFQFTGTIQTYTVPAGVTQVGIVAVGAKGGGFVDARGGAGGSARGILSVAPGSTLEVRVGGEGLHFGACDDFFGCGGGPETGGWNGGGGGDAWLGGGGGGASDVQVNGARILVGGGGGGAAALRNGKAPEGGAGGGFVANPGGSSRTKKGGRGGSQSAGGNNPDSYSFAGGFGYGGGGSNGGGGGGGGWYGGAGGAGHIPFHDPASGGGGSSHASPEVSEAFLQKGVGGGNGYVAIYTNLTEFRGLPDLPTIIWPESSIPDRERLGGCNPSEIVCTESVAQPIEVISGNFYHTFTDLDVSTPIGVPTTLSRTYNTANAGIDGPFGYGWSATSHVHLKVQPNGDVIVVQENGSELHYVLVGTELRAPPRVLATLVKNANNTYSFQRSVGETYEFDTAGRVFRHYGRTADTNTGYGVTTYSYDSSDRLSSITDAIGQVLTFSYSGSRVNSVTDHAGRSVHYAYDVNGDLSSVTAADGGVTTFTYDSQHRLLTMLDPDQHGSSNPSPIENSYDSNGRIAWQDDQENRRTSVSYNTGSTLVTAPGGVVTEYQHQHGLVTAVVTGHGTSAPVTQRFAYDAHTRGLAQASFHKAGDPNRYQTDIARDERGNPVWVYDALGNTAALTYNSFNQPLTITQPNPGDVGPSSITTTFTYDAKGRILSSSTPHYTSATAFDTLTTTYAYGVPGKPDLVSAVTDARGKSTSFSYDSRGYRTETTSPGGRKVTRTVDSLGRTTAAISGEGNKPGNTPADHTTTLTYDPLGRPLMTSIANNATPLTATRTYSLAGQLASVKDGRDNITTFTYDKVGQLIAVNRPGGISESTTYHANGTIATQTDGKGDAITNTLNALGQVASTTNALGKTISATYNALGAPLVVTAPDTSFVSHAYDQKGRLTARNYSWDTSNNATYAYNAYGQRISMTDKSGTTTTKYDSLGRLIENTNGAGKRVAYGYDPLGNLTSITYPNNETVTQAIGDDGEILSITDWQNRTTNFAYNHNGQLTSTTYPNGLVESADFAPSGLLEEISGRDANNWEIAAFEPGFDGAASQVSRNAYGYFGGMIPSETYGYDPAGRLTTLNGQPGFTWDAASNPTVIPGGITQSFNNGQQLVSSTANGGTTYDYDSRGNRTEIVPTLGESLELSYTQANELSWAERGTETYADSVAADNPVAHFRMNEATDMNIWDTSVTYNGWGSGMWVPRSTGALPGQDRNGAVSFQNDSAELWFPDVDANTAPGGSTTIEFFLLWEDQNDHPEVLYSFDSDYGLAIKDGEIGFTTTSDVTDLRGVSAEHLKHQWTHVTAVFVNGNVSQSKLYLDGDLQTLSQVGTPASSPQVTNNATASGNANGDHHLIGTIDELALYNYELGPPRIAAHIKASKAIQAGYTYDGSGLRTETKHFGGDLQIFAYNQAEQVIDDSDNYYLYGPHGRPIAQISQDTIPGETEPRTYYYGHNEQGSTSYLVDQNGFLSQSFSYDLAGNVTKTRGFIDTPLKYRGEYQDTDTLYLYLRARHYDPQTSTFLTRDPLEEISRSAYNYANADPLNNEDPSGLLAPLALGAALWAGIEIAGTAYDIYTTYQTFNDPCTTNADRVLAVTALGIGVVGVGAGYGLAAKQSKRIKQGSEVGGATFVDSRHILWSASPTLSINDRVFVYGERVADRAAEAADTFHNFPFSFDEQIFRTGARQEVSDGYVRYSLPGSVNKIDGVYEIGTRPSALAGGEVVVHRAFRRGT